MKTRQLILTLAAGLFLAGCTGDAQPSPSPRATTAQAATTGGATAAYAYPQGSIKKGDMALCVVCAVNDGATEKEAAAETIDYEGKTYSFCNEQEKAQFISTPAKFASK
jgi:YHS domain-containing protein